MTEILVGLDDATGAQDALAFARRLAAITGAGLRLVTAYPYEPYPSRAVSAGFMRALERDAAQALERLAEPGEATETIPDRSPARALHGVAERTGAALIVVGSTARGLVGRVMPGSTGERLLHGSPCPVAIVPRGYAATAELPIAAVGAGYDGSDESEAALATAAAAARRLDAELRVIRIFDPAQVGAPLVVGVDGGGSLVADLERSQREGLERAVAGLPDDVHAAPVHKAGNPGRELADQSRSLGLMVVGSRGYGPARAVLLGAVSHVLVHTAQCPVLVLPRGTAHAALDALLGAVAEASAQ